jgi:hypothetical protein
MGELDSCERNSSAERCQGDPIVYHCRFGGSREAAQRWTEERRQRRRWLRDPELSGCRMASERSLIPWENEMVQQAPGRRASDAPAITWDCCESLVVGNSNAPGVWYQDAPFTWPATRGARARAGARVFEPSLLASSSARSRCRAPRTEPPHGGRAAARVVGLASNRPYRAWLRKAGAASAEINPSAGTRARARPSGTPRRSPRELKVAASLVAHL